jgi:hypothetical protein
MDALADHAALELGDAPAIWKISLPIGVVVSMFC